MIAPLIAALVLATPVQYLHAHEQPGGGFAEPGGRATVGLTAWAVLGLRAAGVAASALEDSRRYLAATRPETLTDAELVLVARAALGEKPEELLARVRAAQREDGSIGPTVNSTIWGIIALRAAGERAPPAAARWLLRQQRRSGGWSWHARGAPDSNDTAAAVQALSAAGVRGAPLRRAFAYLRRLQGRDGGFALVPGRGSDVQSTAWAIQAFLAVGEQPPDGAFRYLARMRSPDGSYRYSARFAVTPVWVTAQALAAVSRRPLPLPAAPHPSSASR